jgi:hypothetical protein
MKLSASCDAVMRREWQGRISHMMMSGKGMKRTMLQEYERRIVCRVVTKNKSSDVALA